MEVTIKKVNKKNLVGVPVYGNPSTGLFTKAWEILDSLNIEVQEEEKNKAYGLEYYTEEVKTEGKWFYMACMEVENLENIPASLVGKTIPENLYATVTCKGGISKIGDAFSYIYSKWLPDSEYEAFEGYDFEYYDERFLGIDNPSTEIDIYVPIRKKLSK